MKCTICDNQSIKKGIRNEIQKWYCSKCNKYFQKIYKNKQCADEDDKLIARLNNEGVGIRGIARLTGISKSNVINRIKVIASKIIIPNNNEQNNEYEIDEMHTFIKDKDNDCYVIYAFNKQTKEVIYFTTGGRTKENIGRVTHKVLMLNPKRIYTDKLNVYPGLIAKSIHVASAHKINHIERYNLNLRTHLKKLNRKTICYSKSKEMLENCLKIYMYRNVEK